MERLLIRQHGVSMRMFISDPWQLPSYELDTGGLGVEDGSECLQVLGMATYTLVELRSPRRPR